MTDSDKRPTDGSAGAGGTALLRAFASLLEPMVSLAVAHGLTFASVDELLRVAFVQAARRAQPASAGSRIVSRIATASGLTRREVTRLLSAPERFVPARPSPATQVFTRWRADRKLRDRHGRPVALPRQGRAPSFESLAHSVTQDVHPRSLLDELVRLGLVVEVGNKVQLIEDRIVPARESERALEFLGNNGGDHLRASVANLLRAEPPHLEQAVFADELSEQSLSVFREIAKVQWEALLATTAPALQTLIDADAAAGRKADRRVRIGLYTYHDEMLAAPDSPAAVAVPPSPRRRARIATRKKAK